MSILDKFIKKTQIDEKELIKTLQKAPESNNPWDNAYIVKPKCYKGKNKGKILVYRIPMDTKSVLVNNPYKIYEDNVSEIEEIYFEIYSIENDRVYFRDSYKNFHTILLEYIISKQEFQSLIRPINLKDIEKLKEYKN